MRQVRQVSDNDHICSIGTISNAAKATVLELNDVDEDSLKRIMITVETGTGSTRPSQDEAVASHEFGGA